MLFRSLSFAIAGILPCLAVASETVPPKIEWEIQNRFGPFATQNNPATLFSTYKLAAGESFEDWHKRMSENNLPSPYYSALRSGQNGLMHWDQEVKQHREEVLRYVRQEELETTTIRAVARIAASGNCSWHFQGSTTNTICHDGFAFDVPISGAALSVTFEGGEVTQKIEPDHIVIVALGDSYASGEGNPDYPGEWNPQTQLPGDHNLEWLVEYEERLDSPPEAPEADIKHWVDDTCHRSFYSHQSLTALKIASENPHAYVSFLHYACTGAEIFDGLLVPQYQAWGEGEYVPYSQVNFAVRELCQSETPLSEIDPTYEAVTAAETDGIVVRAFHRRGGPGNKPRSHSNLIPNPSQDNFSRYTRRVRADKGGHFPQSGLVTCPSGKIRTPDHVFLNIGGNDIGFADIVQYFVIPTQWKVGLVGNLLYPEVCPDPSNRVDASSNRQLARYCRRLDRKNQYHAGDLIAGHSNSLGMKDRYTLFFNILENRLGIEPSQVVMPQYPDPLRDKGSSQPACEALAPVDFEVPGDTPSVFNPVGAWNGLKAAASKGLIKAMSKPVLSRDLRFWHFNLTPDDARQALEQFDSFRTVLSQVAADRGISFVCETRDAFVGYGWWQGSQRNLPNTSPTWKVSDWQPYAYEAETRAIRTGNDTLLTQPGDKRITGAVHPNLTGHRLIAQMVYDKFWSSAQ